MEANNASYKLWANMHKQYVKFNIGDYVIIHIRSKRYPSGSASKLQAHSTSPFKILKRVDPNECVIDIHHILVTTPSSMLKI